MDFAENPDTTRRAVPVRLYRHLTAHPVRRGIFLFVLVCLIKFAQAPLAFVLPILHFEDGRDMFAFYLNHPEFSNVFRFYAGYVSIPANLVGYCASKVDPVLTPYVYGVVSLCWCAATYVMPASSRMRHLLPSPDARFAVALLVAAMPIGDFALVSVNDYSKWHQLWMFILLLISLPPVSRWGQAVEVLVLALLAWVNPVGIPCGLLLVPAFLLRRTWTERIGLVVVALSLLAYAKWGVDWSATTSAPLSQTLPETVRFVLQRVVFEGVFGGEARIWLLLLGQDFLLNSVSLALVLILLRVLYVKHRAAGRESRIVVYAMIFIIVVVSVSAIGSGRVDWRFYGQRYMYIQQIALLTLLLVPTVEFFSTHVTLRLRIMSAALLISGILVSNFYNRAVFSTPADVGWKVLAFTRQVSKERDPRTRTIPRDQSRTLEMVKDGTWAIRVDIPALDPPADGRGK